MPRGEEFLRQSQKWTETLHLYLLPGPQYCHMPSTISQRRPANCPWLSWRARAATAAVVWQQDSSSAALLAQPGLRDTRSTASWLEQTVVWGLPPTSQVQQLNLDRPSRCPKPWQQSFKLKILKRCGNTPAIHWSGGEFRGRILNERVEN